MRIDKYIWCVRLAKTRSLAADWVKKNRVQLNNEPVKVSKAVKVGDVVQIVRGNATFSFKVLDLLDRRVGAPLVKNYLLETTSSEELEKFKVHQAAQRGFLSHGDGRSSKKDRRALDEFLDTWPGWDEDQG